MNPSGKCYSSMKTRDNTTMGQVQNDPETNDKEPQQQQQRQRQQGDQERLSSSLSSPSHQLGSSPTSATTTSSSGNRSRGRTSATTGTTATATATALTPRRYSFCATTTTTTTTTTKLLHNSPPLRAATDKQGNNNTATKSGPFLMDSDSAMHPAPLAAILISSRDNANDDANNRRLPRQEYKQPVEKRQRRRARSQDSYHSRNMSPPVAYHALHKDDDDDDDINNTNDDASPKAPDDEAAADINFTKPEQPTTTTNNNNNNNNNDNNNNNNSNIAAPKAPESLRKVFVASKTEAAAERQAKKREKSFRKKKQAQEEALLPSSKQAHNQDSLKLPSLSPSPSFLSNNTNKNAQQQTPQPQQQEQHTQSSQPTSNNAEQQLPTRRRLLEQQQSLPASFRSKSQKKKEDKEIPSNRVIKDNKTKTDDKEIPSNRHRKNVKKDKNDKQVPSNAAQPQFPVKQKMTPSVSPRAASLPPNLDMIRQQQQQKQQKQQQQQKQQKRSSSSRSRLRETSAGRYTAETSPSPLPRNFVTDLSDPDPSRISLQDKVKRSFSTGTARTRQQGQGGDLKRRYIWVAVILGVIVIVGLIVIFATDMFDNSESSSSSAGVVSPPPPTQSPQNNNINNNPPSEWRLTDTPSFGPTTRPTLRQTVSPTLLQTVVPTTPAPTLPTLVRSELYCFPPMERRLQYVLWDADYLVQVKQDVLGGTCGPEANRFSRSNVLVNNEAQTLTLQYSRQSASEVRIVLPGQNEVFTYGTFSFLVQSVRVYDISGNVLSDTLPPEIVLGLFTWDDFEYQTNQNFHHEVDIEISRWNIAADADVQFVVQQPGQPQAHRFFSGSTGNNGYQQGGHWYNFTWNPGRIDWNTTAGGGQQVTLTTAKAVQQGETDYIQCLPAKQMDVRMNLWNMLSAQNIPAGLSFFDTVEVVIDNFVYTPSGLEYVEEGSICSKDCQCAPEMACIDNRCVPVEFDPNYVPPTIARPSTPFYCGCPLCVQSIWDTPAQTIYQTCGERIEWYQRVNPELYPTEEAACAAVAEEYACACGRCLAPTCPTDLEVFDDACAPTSSPTSMTFQPTSLTDLFTEDIYCFPEPQTRVEYTLWDDIIVQVKQSQGGLCGPGENEFSDSTVTVTDSGALGMQFTQGVGSEVRMLLPNDRLPYGYGTFSFRVDSVSVRSASGQLLSDVLPDDLVLAMFTWEESGDPADYHSEIAIQLARSGESDNSDLVFTMQPSGYLRTYRSFTGVGETYNQGGHWYNITWLPGRVEWSTDAGGGIQRTITVASFLPSSISVHFRCPPFQNLEVRLNLWNTQGAQQPLGLGLTDIVQVEFGQFVFEPASQVTLEQGDACSRDCQCPDTSACEQNVCV